MKEKIAHLTKLRSEIYNLANSFAGNETGVIAGELHEAANRILRAIEMLEHGITQEDSDRQIQEWCDNQPFPIGLRERLLIQSLMR